MILSIVVFAFGLVICGIVSLGILNAREMAEHMSAQQEAVVQHQKDWVGMSSEVASQHRVSREKAA